MDWLLVIGAARHAVAKYAKARSPEVGLMTRREERIKVDVRDMFAERSSEELITMRQSPAESLRK